MFRAVQRRVRADIRQEPYLGFSALGDVYLAGKDAKISEPMPTQARLSEAAEAWDRTKDTTNIAVLEAFIARFKNTFLAELARARIRLEEGIVVLDPVAGQESHMIVRSAQADALVLIERGDGEAAAGSAVRYLRL